MKKILRVVLKKSIVLSLGTMLLLSPINSFAKNMDVDDYKYLEEQHNDQLKYENKLDNDNLTDEEAREMGYSYEKISKGIKITKYDGNGQNFIIPSKIDDINVVEIGEKVFKDVEILGDVIIPKSVEKLGEASFKGIIVQGNLLIPGSIKQLGDNFWGSEDVSRNDNVFAGMNIKGNVLLEDGIEELTNAIFGGIKVDGDMILPDTIKSYKNSIFSEAIIGGRLYLGTIPNKIPGAALSLESAIRGAISINEIEVSSNADVFRGFAKKSDKKIDVEKIILNEGIEEIGYAWSILSNLNLDSQLILPNSLKIIGQSALEKGILKYPLILPENVEEIDRGAFSESEFELIELNPKLESIDDLAFTETKIKSIEIPKNTNLKDLNSEEEFFNKAEIDEVILYNNEFYIHWNMFENDDNIVFVSYENSKIKEFLETYKYGTQYPNLEFKNFAEISQKVNDKSDEIIEVKNGDVLTQKAILIINETDGKIVDNKRTYDREINIKVSENFDGKFKINNVIAKTLNEESNEEILDLTNNGDSFTLEIPSEKYYGKRPIEIELELLVDGLLENEEKDLQFIIDIDGTISEKLSSNIVQLKGVENLDDKEIPEESEDKETSSKKKRPKKEEKIIVEKKDEIIDKNHLAYIQGYEDNTVRAESNLSREEAATIIYRILDENYINNMKNTGLKYNDILENRWSKKYIEKLSNLEIIEGYSDGEFKPEKKITRAEVTAMLSRYQKGEQPSSSKEFKDTKGHWAEKHIDIASKNNWIEGYPDGTFRPNEEITRAEFITIINNLLDRKVKEKNMVDGRKIFKDLNKNEWYAPAIEEAINSHKAKIVNSEEVWTELINGFMNK